MIITFDIEQLERFYSKLDQKKGGGGGGSQPVAPDPVATANAQSAANKATAIAQGELNMVNQYTPYGSLSYSQRGTTADGTPQYSATQTLDPSGQRQLDLTNLAGERYGITANNQLAQVADKLSAPIDFSTLGPAPTANLASLGNAPTANFSSLGAAPVANEQTRQSVRQSIQDRERPNQDRRLSELQARLGTQGVSEGSKAYSNAMRDYNTGINDFNLGADNQALGQMSQLYGIEGDQRSRATNEIGQQFDFANQSRDRALREMQAQYGIDATSRDRAVNEMIQQRQIPLNELAAMLSGTQVSAPNFVNTPQANIQAGDIQGATYANYQGAQNAYNQQQRSNSSAKGGLGGMIGGLGSAALMSPIGTFKDW